MRERERERVRVKPLLFLNVLPPVFLPLRVLCDSYEIAIVAMIVPPRGAEKSNFIDT